VSRKEGGGEREREKTAHNRLQLSDPVLFSFLSSVSPPSSLSLSLTHSLFRTYLTGKQYHRRLTDGWRAFCAAQNLAMGDAVHFWRDPRDDFDGNHPADEPPALVLRIRVVRRAMAVAPG